MHYRIYERKAWVCFFSIVLNHGPKSCSSFHIQGVTTHLQEVGWVLQQYFASSMGSCTRWVLQQHCCKLDGEIACAHYKKTKQRRGTVGKGALKLKRGIGRGAEATELACLIACLQRPGVSRISYFMWECLARL